MRRPAVLLAIVLAAVLAACGIRGEDEPREVAADDVPFGLLEQNTTTTASFPPETGVPVRVFLVNSQRRLVGVDRVANQANALGAMQGLLQPVTEDESDQGLTNSIPEGTTVLGIDDGSQPGTVVVNLSEEFFDIQGPVQIAAVAQVVWTVTDLPGVSGVRFAFEGEIRPVPRGDGETTSDPLGRPSFVDLAPQS